MNNEALINELETKFNELKKELKLKVGLKELDEIFFIKDTILQNRFVSESLDRQIATRIVSTYMSWNNYLHSLIFPNPGNMINMAESKIFNEDEKNKMNNLVSKAMGLISRNSLIGINRDKIEEAKFFEESVRLWNETYKPGIEKIIKKVMSNWSKE